MFVVLFLFKIVCLALSGTFLFYFAVLFVVSSVAIIAPEMREVVALFLLCLECHVAVICL